MVLNINFTDDLVDHFQAHLIAWRYPFDPLGSSHDIARTYFNAKSRRIAARPRKVRYPKGFQCPPELVDRLDEVIKKVEIGSNLTPHLSTGLTRKSNDALLYEWNIHHLHLGSNLREDGFVERTPELLFAMVDEENFYLIGIFKHDAIHSDELLEVVHRNWPLNIDRFRFEGSLVTPISQGDRKLLRRKNVTSMVQLSDGTCYLCPGGGIATSGDSVQAVINADRALMIVEQLQEHVVKNLDTFIEAARQDGLLLGSEQHWQLAFDGSAICAIEMNTSVGWPLGILSL